MLRLVKQRVTPPGGWRYIEPTTKQQFTAPTMSKLLDKVSVHMRSNELRVPKDLPDVVEDWICRRLPKGLCKDPKGGPVIYRGYHRSTESSVRATMALHRLDQKTTGKVVDQATANYRASICVNCSENVPSAGCMSCRGVKSILENIKRGRKSDQDNRLMACAICGALNQLQVHMKPETIQATTKKITDYPDTCWKREIVGRTDEGARKNPVRSTSYRKPTRGASRSSRPRRLSSAQQKVARSSSRPRRKPRRCCGGSR